MSEREVAVEVVTYDPLRRKGFMRIAGPEGGGRVHFALGMLPDDFKQPIVEISRLLNYHRDLSESAFRGRMGEIRRMVVGACFRASVSFSYGYDDLHRLTYAHGEAASRPHTIDRFTSTFAYSDIHNMTSNVQLHEIVHGDGMGIETPPKTNHGWSYDYAGTGPHQATKIGDTFLTYDANGNTTRECRTQHGDASCQDTADHLRRFFWTEENRLDAVIDGGGENVTSFVYDASGERIVKLGRSGESITIGQFWALKGRRAATKHIFAGTTRLASKLLPPPGWNDTAVATTAATVTTSTATSATNENGCDPSDYQPQKCPILPGGDPVLNHRFDGTRVRPETYYYHPDHLGSTSWVTDQNGKVHEHVEYFPYGEVWRDPRSDADGAPVKGQRFLFTSKEFDEETGLTYFGSRYYDPRRARWISEDPIIADVLSDPKRRHDIPMKLSVYAFASWSPVTRVDPDGADDVVFYYVADADGAFAKAARTYMAELRQSGNASGRLIPIPVRTESEFKSEWRALARNNVDVTSVAFFGHGGKGALYFTKDQQNDGTLNVSEIEALPRLSFASGASIDIHACRTALGKPSAAEAFADSQGVPVLGRTGYSYFSEERRNYVETKPASRNTYLEAYERGKNYWYGYSSKNDGSMMPPRLVIQPKAQPQPTP